VDLTEAYAVLEIPPSATLEEAERVFRELTQVWHPDRFADDRMRVRAARKQAELNLAIKFLREYNTVPQQHNGGAAGGSQDSGQVAGEQAQARRRAGRPARNRRWNGHLRLALVCGFLAGVPYFLYFLPSIDKDLSKAGPWGFLRVVWVVSAVALVFVAGVCIFVNSLSRVVWARGKDGRVFDYAIVALSLSTPVALVVLARAPASEFMMALAIAPLCALTYGLVGRWALAGWVGRGYRPRS